jgi:uncharacterized protein YprB with RNaseH-like and TPR domain
MAKKEKANKQISCCVFDLETTSLNADFGIVLCGVVKPAGGKAKVFRGDKLNPRWDTCRSDDSDVVSAIVEELQHYDIWIAHNGARFDVPFLRTRMLRWGMNPLPTSFKLIDPVQVARNKLRMSWNSLEALCKFLGINKKTEVAGDLWLRASLDGDRKAMSYIVEHCVYDCDMLEDVVTELKAYSTQYNSWGSGF